MAEPEKYIISNININSLLNQDFIKEIRGLSADINAVNLVFISTERKEDPSNKQMQVIVRPLIIAHENENEVKNSVSHVTGDPELIKKTIEILQKKFGGK